MKRTSFWVITGVVVLLGITFGACDMGDDGSSFIPYILPPVNIAKMNITDAVNLFIAPAASAPSSSVTPPFTSARAAVGNDQDKLFKVTEDGYVLEVSYLDENGNYITNFNIPQAVYNVDGNYVIVSFGYFQTGYLVRKSDGAVFSLDKVGVPFSDSQSSNHKNAKIVQQDSSGNIYYGKDFRTIIKIDVSDPDNITKTDFIQTPDTRTSHIYAYDITPAGHAIYKSIKNVIRKSNGGLINLPDSIFWWIGLDGNIRYYEGRGYYNDTTSSIWSKITTVTIDSGFQETLSETDVPIEAVGGSVFKFNDRLLSIGESSITEIENPSNTPREVTMPPGISQINIAGNSDSHYYLSGSNSANQPVLLKIDPVTDAATTLIPPNQYDIYSMSVGTDDSVTFNALRMSDGVKIIGAISPAGTVSILDAALNAEITVLERIR
jgi:hypothetical protein